MPSILGIVNMFTLYNTETSVYSELVNPDHQPGMLPGYLKQHGADVIIAGGMGERARQLFDAQGIALYIGIEGAVTQAVEQFLSQALISKGEFCQLHEHSDSCHHEE